MNLAQVKTYTVWSPVLWWVNLILGVIAAAIWRYDAAMVMG